MLPKTWKRFSVEIEGRDVDDEADEVWDIGLRGDAAEEEVSGGKIASVSRSRDLLTFFVTLLFIEENWSGCLW